MDFVLRLFEVRKGQRIIELAQECVLVGRDSRACDVVLDSLDTLASRSHFEIRRDGQRYFLKNLSKNGTRVNGEEVTPVGRRLYHGDIIEAGNAEITFFLSEESKPADQLFEEGKENELLEPAYSIQCYSLALKQCPTNIEYASCLLNLLEQEERTEDLITGGEYFKPQEMATLLSDERIAAPIARAFVKIGDFARAMDVIQLAGGENASSKLVAIAERISGQTGGEILRTITHQTPEIPFFQRGNLRIYIEERADFADLRYVETYFKYLQQHLDPLFGGPPKSSVVFHVTSRDHLFSQSMPDRSVILGYYSGESKRIFVRPRRWMEGRAREDFHIILMHEYVHFRIDDICGGRWIPKWYNEGLAQVLSLGDNSEYLVRLKSVRDRCKRVWSFSDATFSPVYGDTSLAYLQSYAILSYLVHRFGKDKLVVLLNMIEKTGEDFQHSFESTLNMSLQELDGKWWSILE